MTNTAKNIDNFESEILQERAELIDGETVYKVQPGGEHSIIESSIHRMVGNVFHRKKRDDGSGGWWILVEITVQYRKISESGRQLTADIAGWKRDHVLEKPKGFPIQVRPDWVCEICHTTRKKDTIIVPETLAAEGVEWYWFVDVEDEMLTVFHLENGRYSVLKTWSKDSGKVRLPPFDGVELSMLVLFGDDPEEN